MRKSLTIIGIVLATIILAVLSVITAIRIRNLGTRPIAPNVPESKPKAEEGLPPDEALPEEAACKKTLIAVQGPSSTPTPTSTPGPSPTPTPTSTPGPSATPTPEPTATPLPGPYCSYLQADPTGGPGPLTVTFEGKGYDPVRVKGFRFIFGDGEKKEVYGSFTTSHIERVDHTYSTVGTYEAKLEILDNGDHWRTRKECEVTIQVTSKTSAVPTRTETKTEPTTAKTVAQATPTEAELPVAGIKIPTLGGILAGFLLISLGAALIF